MDFNPLHILVPIDFSDTSLTAIKLAHRWSKSLDAHVTLVHAYRMISETEDTRRLSAVELKRQITSDCQDKYLALQAKLDFAIPKDWQFMLEPGFTYHILDKLTLSDTGHIILNAVPTHLSSHQYEEITSMVQATNTPILLIPERYNSPPDSEANTPLSVFTREVFAKKAHTFLPLIASTPDSLVLIKSNHTDSQQFISLFSPNTVRIANFN